MSNLIARAQGLATLHRLPGPLEFSGPSAEDPTPDAPVEVLAGTLRLRGTRVAEIQGNAWRWLTSRHPSADETEPAREDLVALAGELFDASPAVLAPRAQGATMVVALHLDAADVPLRHWLIEGLRQGPADPRAQLRDFAAARGLPLRGEGDRILLGEQPVLFDGAAALQVPDHGSPTLADVFSDAAYLSIEYQMFFESQHPAQQVVLELASGTAEGMAARVVGTFDRHAFTWGWADARLPQPAQAASRPLYSFGLRHGLLPLISPRVPLDRATRWDAAVIAKPLLGAWTHAVAGVAPGVTALVLLDAPHLRLPPLRPEVREAVTSRTLPDFADPRRALAAYERARGRTS
ncbi:DUF6882 domain-containing protein [Corynebacterium mastitidis]